MSAAKDEADLGPELPPSDTESEVNQVQHDEEQDDIAKDQHVGTEPVLEDKEETSSVGPETKPRNNTRLGNAGVPNPSHPKVIAGELSSADGSPSIPDDTPSLQVRRSPLHFWAAEH